MDRLRLWDEFRRLDALSERAQANPALRVELANSLTIEVTPLKAPTGLGDQVDRAVSMTAATAETARMRIWSANSTPDDKAAASTAEKAIGNFRQLLRTAIELIGQT